MKKPWKENLRSPTKKITKIIHLTATNFYGGPEKQIIEHFSRLDKGSYLGILLSFLDGKNRNEILERARMIGIGGYGIPMSGPLDFRALWELERLLRLEKADLLCAHGYKSTVMGWWAGRKIGIPVIAFSRGYTSESPRVVFYEWLERRILGRLTGVIHVSEGQRRRLESLGVRCRRSWTVHNAVSVQPLPAEEGTDLRKRVCEKLGVPDNAVLVVSAGRLSQEKGHRYLVDAIHKIGPSADGAYFVFCGEGVCGKELEKQAQRLKIADRCRFVGFRRDLDEIFRAMDLMVLPSLTEGLPNVALEAFACAKPVVATAVGGVPEVVEDGENGLLVPARRSDLLAEAMAKLLASHEVRRRMGEEGRRTVETNFTFDRQTRKLEEVYQELLGFKGERSDN